MEPNPTPSTWLVPPPPSPERIRRRPSAANAVGAALIVWSIALTATATVATAPSPPRWPSAPLPAILAPFRRTPTPLPKRPGNFGWRREAKLCVQPPRRRTALRALLSSSGAEAEDESDAAAPDAGIASLAGSDPDRPGKVDQDASFAFRMPAPPHSPSGLSPSFLTCVGAMDGHGLKGHLVTKFLRERLPQRIRQTIGSLRPKDIRSDENEGDDNDDSLPGEDDESLTLMTERLRALGNASDEDLGIAQCADDPLARALIGAFHLAHHDATFDKDIPAGRSGTTCVVALIDEGSGKTHVANVGDSGAVLGRYGIGGSGGAEEAGVEAIALTAKTTTAEPTERIRIDRCEGRIDASGNVFYGPVGIAMTRALGDAVMLRAGVLPTPVVLVWDIPRLIPGGDNGGGSDGEAGFFVILGTDGVFDVLVNDHAVRIAAGVLRGGGSAQQAAEAVAKEARRRWLGDLPMEVKVDDITCAIVRY